MNVSLSPVLFCFLRDYLKGEARGVPHHWMMSVILCQKMQNGGRWCCVMAPLKRDSTIKAGLLMVNLCANFVKDSASNDSLTCLHMEFLFFIIHKLYLLIIILFYLFSWKLAKSPEYFEDLFCGLACFQEYRLRTSGRALRQVSLIDYPCIWTKSEGVIE